MCYISFNIMGNDYDILVIPHSSIIVYTLSWSFENTISIKIVKWKHDFSIFIILTKIVFFHCKLVFVQSMQWRVCNNIGPILISHAPTQYHIWHNSQKRRRKRHIPYIRVILQWKHTMTTSSLAWLFTSKQYMYI